MRHAVKRDVPSYEVNFVSIAYVPNILLFLSVNNRSLLRGILLELMYEKNEFVISVANVSHKQQHQRETNYLVFSHCFI